MPDLVTDGDNLGDHLATRSFKTIKGSDIASATNITIGTSGNTFDVTGTTTIQHFDNANWAVGSVVSLHFDGAVILTNNAGGLTGAQANILLSGDANFTTATGDILTFLLHDSTNWQEVSRNSVASIPDGSITNAKLDTGIDAVKLADGSVTNSELKYINTLSDNAQSQLDLKAPLVSPTFTGTITLPNVPAIVTTQLNLKAPLANPTFTGTVVLPNVPAIVTTQLNLKATLGANTFTGNQSIPATNRLYLDGGSNTYISEVASDDVQLFVGGVSAMRIVGDDVRAGATFNFALTPTKKLYFDNGSNSYIYESVGDAIDLIAGGNRAFRGNASTFEFRSYKKAGAPVAGDLNTDQAQVIEDTTTGQSFLCYNNGGTLQSTEIGASAETPIWKMMAYG